MVEQSQHIYCPTRDWNYMYAVDKEGHFDGFIHTESLNEAKNMIQGTGCKIHSVCKIK